MPPSEYTAAKLATAFPGFSGTWCSPNPFIDSQPANQGSSSGEKSKAPLVNQASLQPRVRDENDQSIVSPSHDPDPPLANIGKKNTRFSSLNRPKTRSGFQPHMYQAAPGLVHASSAAGSASEPKAMAINAQGSLTSMPHGSTQPTMQLPHGTNLTDMFSGHARPPAPVISQQTMPRTTRFASASKGRAPAEPKTNEVPVPLDERQLLHSVHTLQTRVNELELEKEETATRRRSDSANAAAEEERAKAVREELIQDNKSESEFIPPHSCTLINIATELEKTCTELEETCTELLQQRNRYYEAAVQADGHLAVYEQNEKGMTSELNKQNSQIEQLQDENASLGQQLEVAQSENRGVTQDNSALRAENDDLKARLRALTQPYGAQQADVTEYSKLGFSDDSQGPIDMDTQSKFDRGYYDVHGNRVKKSERKAQATVQQPESSHNLTYLSHDGDSSIKKIRKTLEEERKARHHLRQAKADEKPLVNATNKQQAPFNHGFAEDSQHASESSSVATTRVRHTSKLRDELTSAFILPDITMSSREIVEPEPLAPASENHNSSVDISQGSAITPADRSDVVPQASQEQWAQPSGEQVRSQLPTISDEELDITMQSEDPTVRPSQSPEAAVAAVVESVQAELASQRSQLAKYQADYDRLDVELKWRQRKAVMRKIRDLQHSIELKADQLYNLRDLKESHKTSCGGLVAHHQVDNSGQSAGLRTPWQGIRSSSSRSSRSV